MFRKRVNETQEYLPGSNVIPATKLVIPMPKRRDTLVGTLRETYGEGFAPGVQPDTRLDTLLEMEGVSSLSELLKKLA